MQKIELQAEETISKIRLDRFLADSLPEFSRSRLQGLIKQQQVSVNGKQVNNISHKISADDKIEINVPPAEDVQIKPAPHIELDIVYEDEDLLIINKQAGLTVHPGAGNYNDTLVNALLAKVDNLSGINGELRPGIVHRLDRETSGLMLVAKNDKSHNSLAEQIQEREVIRLYHALVWNCPDLPQGTITANLARSQKDRKKMAVVKSSGKFARTKFKLLKSFYNKALSLLECQLDTGRTHQIRVHMEHKKMPLVGDQVYFGQQTYKRPNRINEDARAAVEGFERQALHSKYIGFYHPSTDEFMEFEVDYPEDMKKLIELISQ